MKRLLFFSIALAAPSFAATITIDGVPCPECTVNVSHGTTPTPPPGPIPPSPPAPTPPPSTGCGSGEVFGDADVDWKPLTTTKIFPQQSITASGDYGRAVRFVAPLAGKYPNGLLMELNDQSPQPPPKAAVISACAHNFTPVSGQPECSAASIGNIGDLALFFGQQRFFCSLIPGATYYLNFRATQLPRGDVSSQFTVYGM